MKSTYEKRKQEDAKRRDAIYKDHIMGGLSFTKLAKKYGVTPSRITHIVKRERTGTYNHAPMGPYEKS